MRKTLVVVMLLAALPALANERLFDKSFTVEPGAELSLDVHKGTITVRTHAEPVISINARIYPDSGCDPALVDLTQIETRSGPGYVAVDVDYNQDSVSFKDLMGKETTLPLVDFEISIPVDGALRLSSHKARFDVEAGSGRVRIESHKGHGTISDVRNDFELETHKGSFKVEIQELADVSAETHKGDIELDIHHARDFSIRGSSHDGTLRFDGRDVDVEKDHDGELRVGYREGSGSNRIELDTHKGRIEVRFLD